MGIISILPLLLLLVLVAITKRVIPSMIISVAFAFILKNGGEFLNGFLDAFYEVLAEGTFAWLLIVLPLFGALIQVLIDSGGTGGFRKLALRYINSEKSSLVFSWILGFVLCIDDYINDLAIGPTVRSITDQYKVPREGIGFIVIAMGVPVCSLLPISAISSFVFGIMQEEGVAGADANLVTEMMKVIPFMFYPMVIIIIALLFSCGIMPKIGSMKKAYANVGKGLDENSLENSNSVDYVTHDENRGKNREVLEFEKSSENLEIESNGNIIDFILPVITVIGTMIIVGELVIAVIVGLVVAFAMYIPRKKMSVDKFFEGFLEGVCGMVETLIVILLAFILVNGLMAIGMGDFVIDAVTPYLVGGMIPLLVFLVILAIVYLGVDYWAAMLLMGPIAIPLTKQFEVNPYFTMAAVVSGAIAGATMCMYGEQMLMCSQSVEKKSVELGVCVLPYAIIGVVITAIIYGAVGFLLY